MCALKSIRILTNVIANLATSINFVFRDCVVWVLMTVWLGRCMYLYSCVSTVLHRVVATLQSNVLTFDGLEFWSPFLLVEVNSWTWSIHIFLWVKFTPTLKKGLKSKFIKSWYTILESIIYDSGSGTYYYIITSVQKTDWDLEQIIFVT